MRSRLELVAETAEEYRKASKKDKGKMLDNLTKLTGYNRDYVCHLLNLCRGKTMFTRQGDRVIRARADFKLRRRRNCQGRSKIPPLWPVEFSPTPDFTAGRE